MKDDREEQDRFSPKQIASASIAGAVILLVVIIVVSVLSHAAMGVA